MNNQAPKVCVLAGGDSAEREVSLASSLAVKAGLIELGYSVTELDSAIVPLDELASRTEIIAAEVVFIVLHGGAGENGDVQRVLERAGKRFTGSGSTASALAMNKPLTKTQALKLQIVTPKWLEFPVTDNHEEIRENIAQSIELPVIIKPADGGSTVGLTLVRELSQMPDALALLSDNCSIGMAEEYIAGRELTVAVFEGQPFEVVEIKPKSGLYDYKAKYTKGGSEYFCPAEIDSSVREIIRDNSRRIYAELRCAGLARVDYLLDSGNNPQFLEINTIPGMTDLSLAPMSAVGAGISFPDLLQKSLQAALD